MMMKDKKSVDLSFFFSHRCTLLVFANSVCSKLSADGLSSAQNHQLLAPMPRLISQDALWEQNTTSSSVLVFPLVSPVAT